MSTMRERIAELEAENGRLGAYANELVQRLDEARAEIDRLNSEHMRFTRALDEASLWQDRANAAEQELTALRREFRALAETLRDTLKGGPVVYRRDIADQLERILA